MRQMLTCLDGFRTLSFGSMMLRLLLALTLGGFIGLDRERKGRPAGLRTYMFVCIGACLTMILAQYEFLLLTERWIPLTGMSDLRIDVSRYGAQVINGIGFLGAGTIIVTGRQEVKGLTTAAGLWASGCMGLAIGSGFYECVAVGFVLILLCYILMPPIEDFLLRRARNMNVYIEFSRFQEIRQIIGFIRAQNITIFEVDLEKGHRKKGVSPHAVILMSLGQKMEHSVILSQLSQLDGVTLVEEI